MKTALLSRIAAATLALAALLAAATLSPAQPTATSSSPLAPPNNGMRQVEPGDNWWALTNATVHVKPGETLAGATVIIRDGRILSVTPGGAAPAGANVRDCTNLHIYAGFIEPYIDVEVPAPPADAPGTHWNSRITPQRTALDRGARGIDEREAETLRTMGFTAAAIAPRGGLIRGQSAVVSLAKPGNITAGPSRVYALKAYQTVGFDSGGGRGGFGGPPGAAPAETEDQSRWSRYPNSQMGAIALIRQTLSDADWIQEVRSAAQSGSGERALRASTITDAFAPSCLETLIRSDAAPRLLFDVGDELEALRAAKIAREFSRPAALLGSGVEFKRLDAIVKDGLPIILPLAFPERPRLGSLDRADAVELESMMAWEQGPTNPRRLDAAGLSVSLTTSKLGTRAGGRRAFSSRLSSAIKHGLPPERALAMLTTNPAQFLDVADQLGTVEAGKVASLVITDGPLFQDKPDAAALEAAQPKPEDKKEGEEEAPKKKDPRITEVWIDGYRHELITTPELNINGEWAIDFPQPMPDGSTVSFSIRQEEGSSSVSITIRKKTPAPAAQPAADQPAPAAEPKPFEAVSRATNVRLIGNRLSFAFDHGPFGEPGVYLGNAVIDRAPDGTLIMDGETMRSSGIMLKWSARRTSDKVAPDAEAAGGGERAGRGRGRGGPRGENPPAPPADAPAPAPDAAGAPPAAATPPAPTAASKSPIGKWVLIQDSDGAIDPNDRTTPVLFARRDSAYIRIGSRNVPARQVKIDGASISFQIDGRPFGSEGQLTISAKAEAAPADAPPGGDKADRLVGTSKEADKEPTPFIMKRVPETPETDDIASIPASLPLPFGPYGTVGMPAQEDLLLVGATIWTASASGPLKIENGVILIGGGQIRFVGTRDDWDRGGPKIDSPPWRTLDVTGKHITPGLIDCHSHTGISRGVNESGQAVTAEVRIQDVTDPDAINWYRQLAGGLTAVNNLHGSANPIGGQSQTNKIRWGVTHPDDMHIQGAMPGIKFALGENVKQSNSGERSRTRYPQTRMGVETLIVDRFTAAREYARDRAALGDLVRRDLELEALAEILAGKRLIHCHSYRQDEILMLCRVARDFGFKLGTFQHNLEGYKVANDVRDQSIGASLFSDWWAYKVEVQDAIPYAGPIMHDVGVIVSYNSDSDELARRMNVEAGKVVKYSRGTIPAEEALKFVTLNPAKQLGIDSRTGSLESGKDADLVIWSGHPLSSLSRCETTYVDGRCLFSLEQDQQRQLFVNEERARLIQKILAQEARGGGGGDSSAGGGGGGGGRRGGPGGFVPGEDRDDIAWNSALREAADADRSGSRRSFLASSLDNAAALRRERYLDLLRRGIDPRFSRSGDCGCEEEEFKW